MVKRIIFALLALIAVPAVASTPGQWDVGQQPIAYPTIGSNNIYTEDLGTGVPPFFALQPANIPSTVTTQVIAGGSSTGTVEGKVRFTLFGRGAMYDDPLRNHCQRGASHLHEFLGPIRVGACSTYTQIRTDCVARRAAGKVASTNPGDDINCSPYWHAALIDRNPLGDGINRAKRVYAVPLYYNTGTASYAEAAKMIDFPLALGYVSGANMSDPFMLKLKAAIADANARSAAAGSGSHYEYIGNGSANWSCAKPDGTYRDGPFDNTEDLTCLAGDTLIASMAGSTCADGANLYSPSGYDHVIPSIRVVALNGTFDNVCPTAWRRMPGLTDKPQWILLHNISGTVANDSPYVASDAMFQAAARAQAGMAGAPSDATTFVCKAGCSEHFDYFPAWDIKFLRRAFRKCLGIPWTDTSETGLDADQTVYITECNDGTLSTAEDGGTATSLSNYNQIRFPDVNGDRLSEYYPTPAPNGHMASHTMTGQ